MGSSVSTLYNSLWGTKEFFILMVSTDGSQGSDIFNPTTGIYLFIYLFIYFFLLLIN